MKPTVAQVVPQQRNRYLIAHIQRGKTGPQLLKQLLPDASDPDYLWVLAELVRADLEQSRQLGHPYQLDDYLVFFPELEQDIGLVQQLRHVDITEKTLARSINTQTPIPVKGLSTTQDIELPTCAVQVMPMSGKQVAESRGAVEQPSEVVADADEQGERRLIPRFPQVGEVFLGFRLKSLLGQGAFAKVFFAEQIELNRNVALKVTTRATREPLSLAKLRHTNIMPIHSVHDDAKPLQAVCMPFLGDKTLADLLKTYRETGSFPQTSLAGVSTQMLAKWTTVRTPQSSTPSVSSDPTSAPASLPDLTPIPVRVANKSHEELVLWIIWRLAEGLLHAHQKGILHLDIKPANVLLADEGEPLLLDFNLAYDQLSHDRDQAGGTIPYMAPEQLEDYQAHGLGLRQVDQRTDLFALGVLAYELLTGKLPFPMGDSKSFNIKKILANRQAGPTPLQVANPSLSAATVAMVEKLLEFKPEARYQSAEELLEDLRRHREHFPLKYARNRSWRERAKKWHKRNPNVLLMACLLLAVVSTTVLTYSIQKRQADFRLTEAVRHDRYVQDRLKGWRLDLTTREDRSIRNKALQDASELLGSVGLPNTDAFLASQNYQAMSPTMQASHRAALGELCLLISHAHWLNWQHHRRKDNLTLENSFQWNAAAERCLRESPERVPVVVQRQRDWLQNREQEIPLGSEVTSVGELDLDYPSMDCFLQAAQSMTFSRWNEALLFLDRCQELSKSNYAVYFSTALCQQTRGDYVGPLVNYRVAQVLTNVDPRPAYNLGLILIARKDYKAAEDAFTEALKYSEKHHDSWYHRAITRIRAHRFQDALADVNQAIEHGGAQVQYLVLRKTLHQRLNNTALAQEDDQLLKKTEPDTWQSYLSVGTSCAMTEPRKAITYLEKAAELNPGHYVIWQNLAYIWAEQLHEPEKALEHQDRVIHLQGEFGPGRAGRAILFARLNRREEAHREIDKALLLASNPLSLYQACGVYAQTSRKYPQDAERALQYLRKALAAGYQDLQQIETDPDTKPIRDSKEFTAALNAAKLLRK